MNQIIIFIVGVLAGVALAGLGPSARGVKNKTKAKERNIKKVEDLFVRRGKVNNDDVQALLGVSDATATRYLDELESSGSIRQVGRQGRGVYYEKR